MNYTKTILALLTITLSFFFASCSKEEESTLAGTWEWVSTDGGIGFHIHDTPASTGNTRQLQLSANGNYRVWTNGVQTAGGTYTTSSRKCIHTTAEKTFIDFSGGDMQDVMIERIDTGTLTLSDEAHDGLTSLYTRKDGAVK